MGDFIYDYQEQDPHQFCTSTTGGGSSRWYGYELDVPCVGTFLFTFALMLGPVAGFGMLAGALGVCRPVTRSLYSLAGLLLLGSVASIGMLPWSHAEVPLPMFVAGAAVGILAVLTQARRV